MLNRIKQMIAHITDSSELWEMGTINETVARRNLKTGVCEFVLWKAGQQGHDQDYWHAFGPGWEKSFVPDSNINI